MRLEPESGGAPAMPSGDGKARTPRNLICSECDWKGPMTPAIAHWQATGHPLRFRGYIQDFSRYTRSVSDAI